VTFVQCFSSTAFTFCWPTERLRDFDSKCSAVIKNCALKYARQVCQICLMLKLFYFKSHATNAQCTRYLLAVAMTQQLPNFKCKGHVSIFSLFWFYVGIEDVIKVIL
jgi:hypothetical protein